ncbi:hypothetical protein BaRGS_00016431, partial [Batillaria attramentaria]
MSQFEHVKDRFGNDMWFGDGGEMKFPAFPYVQDYGQQLQRIKQLPLRTEDVIVVSYPKSGNNWIHHMVSMLVEGTTSIPSIMPQNELIFVDTCGEVKELPPASSKPRVLVSHLSFRFLPSDVLDKKVKVVYVTRNPKDVFVSYFCHMQNFQAPMGYEGTWSEFFKVMLEQGYYYGDFFEHLKDWERGRAANPDQPVCHISYEETVKDTLAQVEKLNQFLGTGRDRQLCQAIVDTCRFQNMHVVRTSSEDMLRAISWKNDVPFDRFYRK